MTDKKKTNLLKGTTLGGGLEVYDDDQVSVPKGTFSIKKGKTSISVGAEKPYLKDSKQNMNSTLSLGLKKEGNNSSLSILGTKEGKSKNIGFSFTKTFEKGGGADMSKIKVKKKKEKAKGYVLGESYGNRAKMDYEPNKRFSKGGMCRGAGAAIKGTDFKGVF
jgi:hypothetical protein